RRSGGGTERACGERPELSRAERPLPRALARAYACGRDEAEPGSPRRVDIRIPPTGLGGRLGAMLAWCRERIPAEAWAMHWHSDKKPAAIPPDYVQFYFLDEADAEAFRRRWL